MKPALSLSLTIILLSATTCISQQFPVVGDWANRSPASPYSGLIPDVPLWQEIDSLHCNWLKVNLDEASTAADGILEHVDYANQPYRFIVDRAKNPSAAPAAYMDCWRQDVGDPTRNSAWSNFLARYVRGSFALRLQPESDFDFVNRDNAHGGLISDPDANTTPFKRVGESANAIQSVRPQSGGPIAWNPTANNVENSDLINVTASYLTHVTLRVLLDELPTLGSPVYTVRVLCWNETTLTWDLVGSVQFNYSPVVFRATTTEWQIVTLPISISSASNHTRKDIEVIWEGEVNATLDWVEISTECSREVLHDPATELSIRSAISWYNSFTGAGKSNIGKLFTNDEASYPEFYNLGRVNELITEVLSSAVPGFAFYYDGTTTDIYRWGYLHLSGINEMSVTGWAFAWEANGEDGVFDDGPQTRHAQEGLQAAAANYQPLAEAVRDGGNSAKVFWPVVQTHGDPHDADVKTRFPKHEEIKANIGLALSYGGKGIIEHLVHGSKILNSSSEWIYLTGLAGEQYPPWTWRDETRDSVGARINPRLRGVLGSQLLGLNWQETWEGGFEDVPFETLPGRIVLEHNRDAECVALVTRPVTGPNDTTVYVQLADFADGSNRDFVFVVNKRTMEHTLGDRIIELTFASDTSLFFMDVESHEIEVIPPNGVKTSRLPAGEFSLLRSAGNILQANENLTVDNVMHIRAGAGFHVFSTMTVASGAHVYVEDGAKLYLRDAGSLVLNGGTIVFEGSGELLMDNPSGLRGNGTIITPNIHVSGDLIIPAGTDMTIQGCGTFGFNYRQTGGSHSMVVQGALRLRGTGCTCQFDVKLDEILVAGSGVFDTQGAMTLSALPHINVTDNASFLVFGDDQDNYCTLKFRDRMEFNTQSLLRMEYAHITSLNDTDEWDGILVVGNNSLCDLSYVDLTKVYCHQYDQGSGVHFYESAHPQNRISYCNILRTNKPDKRGDGVFLQPGAGTSYVDIQCSRTGIDWWSGVTTVSSEIEITGLTSDNNLRGLGAHLDGTVVEMYQSEINYNAFQGIFADNSDIHLGVLGEGLNEITQNGIAQIDLTQGSCILQLNSKNGSGNDIGHFSPLVPRITADGTSYAQAVDNYWLETVPVQSMFVEVNQGSIDWNPFLSQSAVSGYEEWTCSYMPKRRMPMLAGPPNRSTLGDYAREGRMTEVYSLLDSAVIHASTSVRRMTLLREFVRMELLHVRAFPDSVETSRNRLMRYLRSRSTILQAGSAADVLSMQAVYFTFAGYPDSADQHFDMLARSYRNTAAYRNSLHARLCNSFIKLDSAAIDETILAMNAAAMDSSLLRLARTERRAYYRCKKSGLLPKRVHHHGDISLPGMSIPMMVHPNPANPTTTVSMTLPEAMDLRVALLTVDGRELRTVFEGRRDKGPLTLSVDVADLQSGVYLCTLRSGAYSGMTRIVTLK